MRRGRAVSHYDFLLKVFTRSRDLAIVFYYSSKSSEPVIPWSPDLEYLQQPSGPLAPVNGVEKTRRIKCGTPPLALLVLLIATEGGGRFTYELCFAPRV